MILEILFLDKIYAGIVCLGLVPSGNISIHRNQILPRSAVNNCTSITRVGLKLMTWNIIV